jgi:hypothetical protein
MHETNVTGRNCVHHATWEHHDGCRQLAAALEEKSELQNAEGRKLEPLLGIHVDCATIAQQGIGNWTCGESHGTW